MRICLFLICLLFSNLSFSQSKSVNSKNGPLEFIELEYGLANVVAGTSEEMKKSPTGTRGWLKDFAISKVTDSIQILPKANFGVVYMVKASDTFEIEVVIEWIYPEKITNEKGEKFKSIKYSTRRPTNIPSASSYSLDAPYEMVKGSWKMNIYLLDKKIYTKTFILY